MAIELLSVNDIKNIRIAEYIVDIEAEKDNIPIEDKVFGTKCYVIESGINYRLNSNLEWIEETETENEGSGGGIPTTVVQSITITRNGTTRAPGGKAYSPVIVEVPDKDEAEGKAVNFIDYDGAIIYSYTATEFANLTTLPPNPVHEGLIAQGWNWTLNDAKNQVANSKFLTIGQNYTTSDGATKIKIKLEEGRLSPYLQLLVAEDVTVTIDWGDNSSIDTIVGLGFDDGIFTLHNYSSPGEYVISIDSEEDDSICFPAWGNSALLTDTTVFQTAMEEYAHYLCSIREINLSPKCKIHGQMCDAMLGLRKISLPNNASVLTGTYGHFILCRSLKGIVIPPNVTSIDFSMFQGCINLKRVSLPKQITTYDTTAFQACYSLESIVISDGVTSVGSEDFKDCNGLKQIYISPNIDNYPTSFLSSCYSLSKLTIDSNIEVLNSLALNHVGLGELHFKSSTPPIAMDSKVFKSLSTDCKIYVPTGSLSAYTSATNYPDSSIYTYIEE